MKKIAKLFVVAFIAFTVLMPLTTKAQEPTPLTQTEILAKIDALKIELIKLLTQLIAQLQAELASQNAIEVNQAVQITQQQIAAPVQEPVQAPTPAFVFDIEINHRTVGDSIKLFPTMGTEYRVEWVITNTAGNYFACNSTGFKEGVAGWSEAFYQQFPEKRLYPLTITCNDNAGVLGSKTITVDTR